MESGSEAVRLTTSCDIGKQIGSRSAEREESGRQKRKGKREGFPLQSLAATTPTFFGCHHHHPAPRTSPCLRPWGSDFSLAATTTQPNSENEHLFGLQPFSLAATPPSPKMSPRCSFSGLVMSCDAMKRESSWCQYIHCLVLDLSVPNTAVLPINHINN